MLRTYNLTSSLNNSQSAPKRILLHNSNPDKPALVKVKLNYDEDRDATPTVLPGDIHPLLTYKDEYFIIRPGKTKKIKLSYYLDEDYTKSYQNRPNHITTQTPFPTFTPRPEPELNTYQGTYHVYAYDDAEYAPPGEVYFENMPDGSPIATPTQTPNVFNDNLPPRAYEYDPEPAPVTVGKDVTSVSLTLFDGESGVDKDNSFLCVKLINRGEIHGL